MVSLPPQHRFRNLTLEIAENLTQAAVTIGAVVHEEGHDAAVVR